MTDDPLIRAVPRQLALVFMGMARRIIDLAERLDGHRRTGGTERETREHDQPKVLPGRGRVGGVECECCTPLLSASPYRPMFGRWNRRCLFPIPKDGSAVVETAHGHGRIRDRRAADLGAGVLRDLHRLEPVPSAGLCICNGGCIDGIPAEPQAQISAQSILISY
jgi:hypothetical protein